MARDREKFQYYTLAIPKESLLLQMLEQDAFNTGIPLQQVLLLRALDWYKGVQSSAPAASAAATIVPTSSMNSEGEEPEHVLDEMQLQANVSALLDLDF